MPTNKVLREQGKCLSFKAFNQICIQTFCKHSFHTFQIYLYNFKKATIIFDLI